MSRSVLDLMMPLTLFLAGCSGNSRLCSLLALTELPAPTYDNGAHDARDEQALQDGAEQKWPIGTPFWRVARDVLATHPRVEPPSQRVGTPDPRRNPHSRQPDSRWVVRFGPEYVEVVAGTFWWYGTWWYTVLLEFDDGLLKSIHVFSDNLTL